MPNIIQCLIRSPEIYQKPAVWINVDQTTGEIVDDANRHGYQNQYRARKGYFYQHLKNSQSQFWWQQYPNFYQTCLKLNREIPDEFTFKMFWHIISSVDNINPPEDDLTWNDIFNYVKKQNQVLKKGISSWSKKLL